MRSIIIIAGLVLFFLLAPSCEEPREKPQEDVTTFIKTFGGNKEEYGWSIQNTRDGGYILTGFTVTFGNDNWDVWLIKTDEQGNGLWNKTFGGDGKEVGYCIQQTTDDGFIIAGLTTSFGNGEELLLIKTDSIGSEQWTKTFGGPNNDAGFSVIETDDGGYLIAGYTYSFSQGSKDVWLIKTDSNGNEQWNNSYGGIDNDAAQAVQQTIDGGFLLAGYTSSFGNGNRDLWLIKTDSNGNEQWNKTFGGPDDEAGYAIQPTTDGGYIISGSTNVRDNGWHDLWLIKTDFNGNETWSSIILGSSGVNDGWYVQETDDYGFIIVGSTNTFLSGENDVYLIKTDSAGEVQWNYKFGGVNYDGGWSVVQADDGGFVITGTTSSIGNGMFDILLIKTDSNGNTSPRHNF